MRLRTTRQVIWLGSAVLIAGAVLSVVMALLIPVNIEEVATPDALKDSSAATSQQIGPTDADFANLWAVNLRQPLYDAPASPTTAAVDPAPVAVAQPPPATPLMIRLTGTIIEGGNRFAILAMPDEKRILKRVGDQADGAEIIEIGDGMIRVRHQGTLVELQIVRPR